MAKSCIDWERSLGARFALEPSSLLKRSRQKRKEKSAEKPRRKQARKDVCLRCFCKKPTRHFRRRGRECEHDSHTRSNSKRTEPNNFEHTGWNTGETSIDVKRSIARNLLSDRSVSDSNQCAISRSLIEFR